MKRQLRLERFVPGFIRRNLAAISMGGALLGGLLIGSADIFDMSGTQSHRQTGQQEQEEATDQAIQRKINDDPNIVMVAGISPQTDHTKSYAQAEVNHKTAGILRGVGGSSLACAVGLGAVAAARRRRENHIATTQSQAALRTRLTAFAERRMDEKRTRLPIVPYIKPEVTTDTVRQEVRALGLSIGSTCASIEAMTLKMSLDAESTRRQTRDNELNARIAAIRQEHAAIRAEMEQGRQATLAGFATLRAQLGAPQIPDSSPLVMPPIATRALVPAMA